MTGDELFDQGMDALNDIFPEAEAMFALIEQGTAVLEFAGHRNLARYFEESGKRLLESAYKQLAGSDDPLSRRRGKLKTYAITAESVTFAVPDRVPPPFLFAQHMGGKTIYFEMGADQKLIRADLGWSEFGRAPMQVYHFNDSAFDVGW